jgi:hypothetical protein
MERVLKAIYHPNGNRRLVIVQRSRAHYGYEEGHSATIQWKCVCLDTPKNPFTFTTLPIQPSARRVVLLDGLRV